MSRRVRCDEVEVLALVKAELTNEQLCAELGITTRTFTRWRVARPELSRAIIAERQAIAAAKPEAGHGTPLRYRHGCKCDTCRAANTQRHRRYAARARSRPVPEGVPHGRQSTYNWHGCRCQPCTHANTEASRPYGRAYNARRRAARAAS